MITEVSEKPYIVTEDNEEALISIDKTGVFTMSDDILKDSLNFAVLTGCLRVSKESIFTGLNNLNVYTVKDVQYNEYFGFTDTEVRQMLAYYGFVEKYGAIKEWYDGYRFGELGIYCPQRLRRGSMNISGIQSVSVTQVSERR